jgi:drug/metabolite transporter (DMT)-like permease
MSKTDIPTRAWIDLMLLTLVWGGIFLVVEFALRGLTPLWAVFHRVFWAAIALWIYAMIRGYRPTRDLRLWGAFTVMGALNNAIPFSLITWGQVSIESGLASILNGTTAFFGITVAAIMLADEKLTVNRVIGVIMGVIGVAIIMGVEAVTNFDPRSLGQVAVLGGALSYAFAGVWARKKLAGQKPIVSAASMLTGSSLLMLPVAWLAEGPPTTTFTAETIGAIIYMSIFGSAAAYILYYRILDAAGAGNLMLVTVMMPPISIFLGWLVLDEVLTANALIGCGVILTGLVVLDGRTTAWVAGQIRGA